MCVWQSISPGRIVAPLRSITSAPAGIGSPEPTCVTLSSCTMIIAFVTTVPVFGSTRRAALTTVILGGVGFAGAADWAASDEAARSTESANLVNFMKVMLRRGVGGGTALRQTAGLGRRAPFGHPPRLLG